MGVLKVWDGTDWRKVGCGGGNTYAAEVMADAPAVYLRLGDAVASTTAADSSGNSRPATQFVSPGPPTFGSSGLLYGDSDTCATFPGYLYVPYGSWMNVSAMTVEAIIQTASFVNPRNIWDRDNIADTRHFQFRIDGSGGHIQFILIGTSVVTVTGATSIDDNTRHHVAATYDGSVIKLYVDGVLDGTVSTSVALPSGTSDLHVGVNRSAFGGALTQGYSGDMDEAAFYPTALSGARIAAHAAAIAGTPPGGLRMQLPDGSWVREACDNDPVTFIYEALDPGTRDLTSVYYDSGSNFWRAVWTRGAYDGAATALEWTVNGSVISTAYNEAFADSDAVTGSPGVGVFLNSTDADNPPSQVRIGTYDGPGASGSITFNERAYRDRHPLKIEDPANPGTWITVGCFTPA